MVQHLRARFRVQAFSFENRQSRSDKDRPRHFAKRTQSFAAEIGALLRTTPKAACLVFIDENGGRPGFDFDSRQKKRGRRRRWLFIDETRNEQSHRVEVRVIQDAEIRIIVSKVRRGLEPISRSAKRLVSRM